MRVETIELFNYVSLREDFKPILAKVLKGMLVAASVWITASVVSEEETKKSEIEKSASLVVAGEIGRAYAGTGSEIEKETNSILNMMEDPVGLSKAVVDAREDTVLNDKENAGSVPEVKAAAPADPAGRVEETVDSPAAGIESADTAAETYMLTFEGALPSDHCVGSTIDLSEITFLYGGEQISLEEAKVEIPDTGEAGKYEISVEYEGSKVQVPFGVVDYQVLLNGNGGVCPADVIYLTDYVMKEETIPSYPGREFTGWYRDKACTVPFVRAERGETVLELYAGWVDSTGFAYDSEGYITGYTGEGYGISDGLLVLPDEEGCVGIRAGAFDAIEDPVFEIYIPAGITDIELGALENLIWLFYIEVDPNNPIYESRGGVLYSKTSGDLVLMPAGR